MKFTLSWLKDHLETEASLDEIVTTLTRIGLEVEGVEDPGKKLAGFTIAYVISRSSIRMLIACASAWSIPVMAVPRFRWCAGRPMRVPA